MLNRLVSMSSSKMYFQFSASPDQFLTVMSITFWTGSAGPAARALWEKRTAAVRSRIFRMM
ncbi:hypothetical protein D3C77_763580 [compost metagenome]